MAYAALLSLSHTIDIILRYHQHSISSPAKYQIISIAQHLAFLQHFLQDFPDEARPFEALIRAVTLAAEDIIELFLSAQIHHPRSSSPLDSAAEKIEDKSMSLDEFIWKTTGEEDMDLVYNLLSSPYNDLKPYYSFESSAESSNLELNHQPRGKSIYLHCDFQELKEVREEIESIAEKMMRIKNCITVNDVQLTDTSAASLTSLQEHVVVGFEDNLMYIKCALLIEKSNLEVLPIVGMGGIGKTTLAKKVYNDQLIMEHFDVRVWVTVSQDYSAGEIISSFLASMQVFTADSDLMKKRVLVYQHLMGRRFLIVVDDIWSVDVWDDLKLMLPDDGRGSRIILTTRLLDVASYADSSNLTHTMHLMNNDRSWDLLRRMVFKHDPCPIKLENIGKTIARRCRGLPLAIVVVSGTLSSIDKTEAAWSAIAENVKSAIHTNEEQVDKILSLSYAHLPRHLRLCLLYIGGFPEDYKMSVSKLVRLWMAEGFLRPSGSKSLEETGEEYLKNLVKRSLVLITKHKTNGRMKVLSMHDLIRDLCVRKAQQENLFNQFLGENRSIPICVSASHSGLVTCTRRYLHDIQRIGSLGYYRLLRILDLFSLTPYRYRDLPSEIFNLFHLRYIAFHCHFGIPTGISKLQNLQTFIIYTSAGCEYYAKSASFLHDIWNMPQLRHVRIDVGFFFCHPPFEGEEESFVLENLHTLSVVKNFVCTSEIASAIPNLKKLVIRFMDRDDEEDYHLYNLMYLEQLENLKLYVFKDFPSPEKVKPVFPCSLKKLTLHGLELPWEDLSVVGSLPNLEVLKLRYLAYVGDTWETREGGFPQLKFLLIDASDLEKWITESSHFPQLKFLVLYRCPCLEEIPDDIGEIPMLELIEVDKWNNSLVESAKRIRENQHDCGNVSLQIRIVKALPVP